MIIDPRQLYWTEHVKAKMRHYGLSASRVKRVLRYPKRLEVGIAPDTMAGMQPAGSKGHPHEIWVMWVKKVKSQNSNVKTKFKNGQTVIISTWKYPGVSPVHEPPPIPDDVWEIVRKGQK